MKKRSAPAFIRFLFRKFIAKCIAVYDQLGQKLAILAEGRRSAGKHQARVDAAKLAAGIYLYSLTVADTEGKSVVLSGKIIIAK